MAKFYFDCHDGLDFMPDEVGTELLDVAEVADQAAELALVILGEVSRPNPTAAVCVTVRQGDGTVVHSVTATIAGHSHVTARERASR